MMANAKAFSDTALVVISRSGGEGADLPTDMAAVIDLSLIHIWGYKQNGDSYELLCRYG